MCSLSITLHKQKNELFLKTTEVDKRFRFIFTKLKLIVPKITVAPQVQLALERRLLQNPAAYHHMNIR